MRSRWWLAALMWMACDGEVAGPGDPPVLREGVQVIATFEYDTEMPGDARYVAPRIMDVLQTGEHIYVLFNWIRGTSLADGLTWSDDGGLTWQTDTNIERSVFFSGEPPGRSLVSDGERVWIVQLVMGDRSLDLAFSPLSFDGGEVRLGDHFVPRLNRFAADGGELATLQTSGGGGGSPWTVSFQYFSAPDVAEMSMTGPSPFVPEGEPDCVPPAWHFGSREPDGDWRFLGNCTWTDPADASRSAMCVYSAGPPSQLEPFRNCAFDDAGLVGSDLLTLGQFMLVPYFAGWYFTDGGEVRAARVRVDRLLQRHQDVLTVGPGELLVTPLRDTIDSAKQRTPYGGFVPVLERLPDDGRRLTLYRYDRYDDTFTPSGLPARPCPDGAYCGYRIEILGFGLLDQVLQWVQPLGGDRYRMFYTIDALPRSSTAYRVQILMSEETLDLPPRTLGDGVDAGPLEIACVRAASCFPTFGENIDACTGRWLAQIRGRDDASDAAYQRFIAATSCDEIAAADPRYTLPDVSCASEYICHENRGYECAGGVPVSFVTDCAVDGGVCTLVPPPAPGTSGSVGCVGPAGECADETFGGCLPSGAACQYGHYVDCPSRGLTCATNGGSVFCAFAEPGCDPASGRAYCDGDALISCVAPDLAVVSSSCARIPGYACAMVSTVPDFACAPVEEDCTFGANPECDGDVLRYCLGTSVRELDCTSIGARCVVDETGAACR